MRKHQQQLIVKIPALQCLPFPPVQPDTAVWRSIDSETKSMTHAITSHETSRFRANSNGLPRLLLDVFTIRHGSSGQSPRLRADPLPIGMLGYPKSPGFGALLHLETRLDFHELHSGMRRDWADHYVKRDVSNASYRTSQGESLSTSIVDSGFHVFMKKSDSSRSSLSKLDIEPVDFGIFVHSCPPASKPSTGTSDQDFVFFGPNGFEVSLNPICCNPRPTVFRL